MSDITFRPGTPADSYAVFEVFEYAIADLNRRLGRTEPSSADSPEGLARMWEMRRSLFEHMAASNDQFWVAERNGRPVGYARSTLHDGLQELTELFIHPEVQSAGIGRELLTRAFPEAGARQRSIIASPDLRALALYLKAGLYPRFSIYYFYREPGPVAVESDLAFEPITASAGHLAALASIDEAILEHRRETDHRWLMADRQGYLYLRRGRPVGYGYMGLASGPFALLDEADFPAVLAHAENSLAGVRRHFGLEVPMINETAVDYLLVRGFRMDLFFAQALSATPFGRFEKVIITSPPFIL
jgi:GNAT superfamily N-acetyltransferase